jgi:hypothetical protein
VAGTFVFFLCLGLMKGTMGAFFAAIVAGYFACSRISKLKAMRHTGFLWHFLFWWLPQEAMFIPRPRAALALPRVGRLTRGHKTMKREAYEADVQMLIRQNRFLGSPSGPGHRPGPGLLVAWSGMGSNRTVVTPPKDRKVLLDHRPHRLRRIHRADGAVGFLPDPRCHPRQRPIQVRPAVEARRTRTITARCSRSCASTPRRSGATTPPRPSICAPCAPPRMRWRRSSPASSRC